MSALVVQLLAEAVLRKYPFLRNPVNPEVILYSVFSVVDYVPIIGFYHY